MRPLRTRRPWRRRRPRVHKIRLHDRIMLDVPGWMTDAGLLRVASFQYSAGLAEPTALTITCTAEEPLLWALTVRRSG